MKNGGKRVPSSACEGSVTVNNRLYPGHRYRSAMDQVFERCLKDLSGHWDLSVYAMGGTWFRIDVVAPDGVRWSLSVPVHEGPRTEDLAQMIKAACIRHLRMANRMKGNGDTTKSAPAVKSEDRSPARSAK
jgi:hypothetical protein